MVLYISSSQFELMMIIIHICRDHLGLKFKLIFAEGIDNLHYLWDAIFGWGGPPITVNVMIIIIEIYL